MKLQVGKINLNDMERAFNRGLASFFSQRLTRAEAAARSALPLVVERHLRSSRETDLITKGRERHELGLVDPDAIVESVIQRIVKFAHIRVHKPTGSGSSLNGSMTVALLRKDMLEALGAKGAAFVSENEYDVPWMEWVLLGDDEEQVLGFKYEDRISPHSRTGRGIMVKDDATWVVPPSIRGTDDDNWLIRALRGIQYEVGNVIAEAIKGR